MFGFFRSGICIFFFDKTSNDEILESTNQNFFHNVICNESHYRIFLRFEGNVKEMILLLYELVYFIQAHVLNCLLLFTCCWNPPHILIFVKLSKIYPFLGIIKLISINSPGSWIQNRRHCDEPLY